MPKVVNLLGIRTKAILCRIKVMGNYSYTVMRPITEEEEKLIDRDEKITIDDNVITKDNIYCYGEFDITNPEDINYIGENYVESSEFTWNTEESDSLPY